MRWSGASAGSQRGGRVRTRRDLERRVRLGRPSAGCRTVTGFRADFARGGRLSDGSLPGRRGAGREPCGAAAARPVAVPGLRFPGGRVLSPAAPHGHAEGALPPPQAWTILSSCRAWRTSPRTSTSARSRRPAMTPGSTCWATPARATSCSMPACWTCWGNWSLGRWITLRAAAALQQLLQPRRWVSCSK